MNFMEFMKGHEGKALRNVLGALLIGLGYMMHYHNKYWWIVFAVGFVPVLAATFDFCILSLFSQE